MPSVSSYSPSIIPLCRRKAAN